MTEWSSFEQTAPELAAFALARLAGRVAYLATLRPDGAPRVHPVTPIIGGGRLFLFMEPTSPKGADLRRDARFALHCGVEDTAGGGGEVALNGRAVLVDDPQARAVAAAASSYAPQERYVLFALQLDSVLVVTYGAGGSVRQRWPNPT